MGKPDASRTLRFELNRLDLADMTVKPHTIKIVGPAPTPDIAGLCERLRAALEGVTPGDLDTSDHIGSGNYNCPCCEGEGAVEGKTFTNFDGFAIGVQFFGVGDEFAKYEAFFRAANPQTVRALLDTLERQATEIERLRGENRDLRSIPWPRAYVLGRASEWKRLLREIGGYVKTCRGSCGSDMAGRDHAIAATAEAVAMIESAEARAALTGED